MGSPEFCDSMAYAPERVYDDKMGKNRRVDEMWTGDWWWQAQDKLAPGGTVGALVISTDKTQLSTFRGDKQAYPVYLTLGNISKDVRRQPSRHAATVIAYLPTSKLKLFKNNSLASYRLFHYCMKQVLAPLVKAGRDGVDILCSDGWYRRVHPLLAAYLADHPEQCLVACCAQNRCPRCVVPWNERGEYVESASRRQVDTLRTLNLQNEGEYPDEFVADGLKEVFAPFWADLPHTDIFRYISSDILHQLHQGIFKDHLLKWCQTLVNPGANLDDRFRAMPPYPGLRHFTDGISKIKQWTGGEHKEVQRVLVAALAGAVNADVLTSACALIDFIFLAQYHSQTTETLTRMEEALKTFHDTKGTFSTQRDHFNLAKLHALLHYIDCVLFLGSLDGLNTENTERLHINFAKRAYRASNRKDFITQMAMWLQRHKAVAWWDRYLDWRLEICAGATIGLDAEGDELQRESQEPSKESVSVGRTSPFPNMPVSSLIDNFGAHHFTTAVTGFLRVRCALRPNFEPSDIDTYNVFGSAVVHMKPRPFINVKKLDVRVYATPLEELGGRKGTVPPRWDTVLVEVDSDARRHFGGLSGLRVAELRVIFKLPSHLGKINEPLAYVHWFRELNVSAIEPNSGMFKISKSTRHHLPYGEVIPLSRIVRPCHMIPYFGTGRVPRAWLQSAPADAHDFLLNKYIDVVMFEDYVVHYKQYGISI
ncbi:hypothetical protein CONPUDRAFT_86280 [Coniophora puteana RWD-64-598 SS2]|uniref:Uncharacterized protein n=1 Tax=Coniophora puteana (strain RWD-64-598) TaxID=741705 RepID=A0A5M3N4B8_CONPW|nr:uncharacterized protein CONPUDRAFT_86280 [Coniophora puteana RWD-64-598 SS2]EIW86269.1 hypothetical protein CONPUDRAFT_86280 [Coniophora puteana RWD-64-598 SS2]